MYCSYSFYFMPILISEPVRARPVPAGSLALWQLGFRPFYLLAALFAALSIPLWALQFSGLTASTGLRGPLWHAHEMVFGYTLAIVVGFLFTAGRNWSGQATPTGRPLMALAGLWVVARVLVLTPFELAAAVVNVAFPLLAAWSLWRALRNGNNKRNYFFVPLLIGLAMAAAVVHASQLGWIPASWTALPAGLGITVALDVLMFIVAVMAGRVVPMFTNNGVTGAGARRVPHVERLALGSVLALLAADLLQLHGVLLAAVLLVALLAHATRWWLWNPWATRHAPLVWVLHLAYAWLPVHLALRAAAELGWVAPGLATHALTVGLIGGITLGMITRTTLGHTGRLLQAGPVEVAAFLCVSGAALARVGLPLIDAAWLMTAVGLSAALWSAAFVLYLWRYTPFLLRARIDGLAG
jgi:uncharacterized protein involved in response to NO